MYAVYPHRDLPVRTRLFFDAFLHAKMALGRTMHAFLPAPVRMGFTMYAFLKVKTTLGFHKTRGVYVRDCVAKTCSFGMHFYMPKCPWVARCMHFYMLRM